MKLFVKDDKHYKIEQINNIYLLDVKKDGKLLDELFNTDSSNRTLLCYDNDINLFNLLKDIYQKYKNDKGNPFVNYCLDCNNIDVKEFNENIHGIKVSNKKNSTIVKKIRYYSAMNEPYIDSLGGYIVTPDYAPADWGISMQDILSIANQSHCKNKIIIFMVQVLAL